MILKYIPNTLTIFRLLLIVPFLVSLYFHKYPAAFYIYFIAGLTDCLDGWLARHYHWQSYWGSFLDPLADKLLIASSFISLALLGPLPWWLVILVFLRDLTISLGVIAWYLFIPQKLHAEPTVLSKFNTLLQLVVVTLCLFELAFLQIIPTYIFDSLIILIAVTTAITYFDYVWTWGKKAYSICK